MRSYDTETKLGAWTTRGGHVGLNSQRKENHAGNAAGRDQTQRDGEEAKLNTLTRDCQSKTGGKET